jgi:hypothetical protein
MFIYYRHLCGKSYAILFSMRKIIVFENVTLNGLMAGPKGEIDWAIQDAESLKTAEREMTLSMLLCLAV